MTTPNIEQTRTLIELWNTTRVAGAEGRYERLKLVAHWYSTVAGIGRSRAYKLADEATRALRSGVIAAVVAGTMLTPAAQAGTNTSGYDLYANCTSASSHAENLICIGYLGGAGEALIIAGESHGTPEICGYGFLTPGHTELIFKRWAELNPNKLHLPRAITVIAALKAAYPCGAKAAPRTSSAPLLHQ